MSRPIENGEVVIVSVTREAKGQLLEFIWDLGSEARILDKLPTIDRVEILRQLREEHAKLVEQLAIPKSPEVEASVNSGYERLMGNLFHGQHPELSAPRFREAVGSVFSRCLIEEPAMKGDTSDTIYWGNSILRPSQVRLIVDRYGLMTGKMKSMKELAEGGGKNRPKMMADKIAQIRHSIIRNFDDMGIVKRRYESNLKLIPPEV